MRDKKRQEGEVHGAI